MVLWDNNLNTRPGENFVPASKQTKQFKAIIPKTSVFLLSLSIHTSGHSQSGLWISVTKKWAKYTFNTIPT